MYMSTSSEAQLPVRGFWSMLNKPWCPRQELEWSCLPHGEAGLRGSRKRQRLLLPILTASSQQEGSYSTGICPGAGLTFWEGQRWSKVRRILMNWEHQASNPVLACSSWCYSIQRSAAGSARKAVIAQGLCSWWGKTIPPRAALRDLASGCPTAPQRGLFLLGTLIQKCKGWEFNTAVRGYRINVRKTTELRKKTQRRRNHSTFTYAYMVTSDLTMDATPWLWTQQGLCPPWLHGPEASCPRLGPHAVSPMLHGHLNRVACHQESRPSPPHLAFPRRAATSTMLV